MGYQQGRIKEKKETVKAGSKEAGEQEVEQPKHMTEEIKQYNSRSRKAQKDKSREAAKTKKQKSN